MNFYIDVSALQFGNWSGVQFYIYRILSAMAESAPQHTFHLHFGREGFDPRISEITDRANVMRHDHPGRIRSYVTIPVNTMLTRSRVYYMMSGDGKLRIPVPARTAAVLYDCGRYVVPECYNVADLDGEKRTARTHLNRRDLIVTISHSVKAEIVELFGVPPERIVVAPCAVDPPRPEDEASRPSSLAEDRPYFLMVNPGRPYKNWQDAIAGFALYTRQAPQDRDSLLVLAGDLRYESDGVKQAIAEAGCAERVVCAGYVTESEIRHLYRNARLALFPSLYEGFGIPALEAMAYNVPLIISDIPVLREVTDGAALTVPLRRPSELADAMQQLNTDEPLRSTLQSRGIQRVGAYNWLHSAETTLTALTEIGLK